MATPAEDSRDAQLAIAEAAAALASRAWPELDLHDLRRTMPRFKLQIAAAVRHYSPGAARAAIRFYLGQRRGANIPGTPRLNHAPAPSLEHVGSTVNWVAEPLWGDSDLATAEKRLEAAVERLVLNVGRETLVDAVQSDRQAIAWARVPEPDACYFCAMLATRGAVFTSAHAAGENNDYHDHCRCHVEPVFTAYEPTARIRQWQADWNDLKREHGGVSLSVWRAHYDATYVAA